MTVDIYKYFLQHPRYNKLVGDGYLFVEYKCPLEVQNFKLWTEAPILNYVISGKKDWISLNKTHHVKQGEALFIKQGVYNTKQYFINDYCVMLFFLSEDFIRRFVQDNVQLLNEKSVASHAQSQIYPVNVNDSLNTLFLSIFNYMNQGKTIPKDLVDMKFNELLYNIALDPANGDLVNYFCALKSSDKSNLDTVMMKNFHCDLNLEEFARLSGRSLSTFKRDFKTFYNETPGKWLNNKRLEYAKSLLESTELNINEICFESGFKNPSHFNSSFKKKYQLPPNQYKKEVLHQ